MDREKRPSPFSLAARATPPDVRDKDNTQMRPKPPERIDHPRLAPGGSVGIRLNRMPQQAIPEKAPPNRPTLDRKIGKPSEVHKEFKSIVTQSHDKGHGRER